MKKLLIFVPLLCAFAFSGCEGWVQDRRYPWQMEHDSGVGNTVVVMDATANDPCDEEVQPAGDAEVQPAGDAEVQAVRDAQSQAPRDAASKDADSGETAAVTVIDAGVVQSAVDANAKAATDAAVAETAAEPCNDASSATEPDASANADASENVDASANVDASLTGKNVVFDLPQNWSREEEESQDRAILNGPSADQKKPEVVLQANVSKLQGVEADARKFAEADYNERMMNCEGTECFNTYYQMKYIGGTKIYISAGVNTYWGNDSAASIIWFEKAGTVYRIDLDDKVEAQTEAVKQVIETIRLN